MTPEILIALLGAALSLLFSYVPWLNVWFAALPADTKRIIMAGLLLVTAVIVYVGQCYLGLWQYDVTCDKAGMLKLAEIYLLALMANQGAYLLSPQTKGVKEAKAK